MDRANYYGIRCNKCNKYICTLITKDSEFEVILDDTIGTAKYSILCTNCYLKEDETWNRE